MAIVADTNIRRYEDVEELVDVSVDMPLFSTGEVYVLYGEAGLPATLNVDYTLTLNEDTYNDFVLTPLESLITKIDAQITAEPTDRNTILIVRSLDYLTTATTASVQDKRYVSREFDRIAMRFQQLDEWSARVPALNINNEDTYDLELPPWEAGAVLSWHPTDKRLINNAIGNVANLVEDAQEAAAAALASEIAAGVQAATATTQAGIATTQASLASGYASSSLANKVAAQAAQAAAEAAQTAAEVAAASADGDASAAAADASLAITARIAAEAARDAALAAFDNFDDKYLGAKASNPALDNDGNALVDGAIYWNSTVKQWRAYDLATTTWYALAAGNTASGVSYVPTGALVGVNVQDALDELEAEKLATSVVDTDGTLTANSDAKVASQKAVKTFVNAAISGVLGGVSAAFDTLAEIAAELANKANSANATFTGTFTPPDNTIARSKLVNGAATSVVGRSANTSGAVADITTTTDSRVLARTSGSILDFVQITAAMITDAVITYAKLATAAIATAAEFRSNTASKLLDAAGVWGAAAEVALTDAATIAVDLATFLNGATVVLGGNRTLGNPSNDKVGQCFTIWLTASGGTRTLALDTQYKVGAYVEAFPISVLTTETVGVHCMVRSSTLAVVTGVTRYTT